MNLWYVARATGFGAFLAFSLATALGALTASGGRPSAALIAVPQRAAARLDRRFVVQMLHRSAALTGLTLLAAHAAAIVVDSYVDVSVVDVFVPLASSYQRVAVAVGVLALWSVVVATFSGALRGRLAAPVTAVRLWRVVHASAYVGWAVMLLHGVLAGTDATTGWGLALYGLGAGTVCLAGIGRLVAERRRRRSPGALVRAARWTA